MRRLLICLVLIVGSGAAVAAAQPLTLAPGVHARVVAAHEAFAKGELAKTETMLREMAAADLSPYAKALVHRLWGNLWLQRNDYPQARRLFQIAYDETILPEAQQLNLLHALAQLDLSAQHWQSSITRMNAWMARMAVLQPENIRAQDYLVLAQASAQLERWRQVVAPIQRAISLQRDAPQSWYQLYLAALLQDNQKPAAIELLNTLVVLFPAQGRYWEQLAVLYGQTGQPQKALGTLRLAYLKQVLVEERQLLWLARALINGGAPQRAADVLDKAMTAQRVKADRQNLQLLADAWLQAREYAQARPVLQRLVARYPSAQALKQLATVNVQLKDWQSARRVLQAALRQQPQDNAELHLLYGIASANVEQTTQARTSFLKAAEDSAQAPAARQWLRYLDQLAAKS